ncbi:MAG: hypothetical protein IT362_06180 [Deltaproteobacteria bacterium]|nr:hypothetical protein [Deltaproteobacteria bacterium]
MKALVMDGGQAVRSMVVYMLRVEGFDVREASGAPEVERHLDSGFTPNILISCESLDSVGVSSLKSLKAHPAMKMVPVLLLADKGELARQMEWKDAGVTCWLTWPVTPERFIEMVRMVMFDEAR